MMQACKNTFEVNEILATSVTVAVSTWGMGPLFTSLAYSSSTECS